MSELKFDEISGKGVLTQDGREVGQVADMVVNHAEWTIRALVVKLDRELLEQFHMKKPMFGSQTIQLPVTYVSGVGDKVILHKQLDELTALAKDNGESEADA